MTIPVVIFQLTKFLCQAVKSVAQKWQPLEAEEELLRTDQAGMKLFSDYDQIMINS